MPQLLSASSSISRRTLLRRGSQLLLASLAAPTLLSCTQQAPEAVPLPDRTEWNALDQTIRGWWDGDLKTSLEADVAADAKGTLLYLPYPYLTPGGSESDFNEMYGWDTFFINLALLAHGRLELVENHIRNHLHMVERYGMVLNGNRSYYLTRSQPPFLAETVRRFVAAGGTLDLARDAYPLLEREYRDYWQANHHDTPVGLATNRDLGAEGLRPALAAEAETGLDFTAIYGGDVRRCTPLLTNCALVQYAGAIATIAEHLGNPAGTNTWRGEAQRRTEQLQTHCWDDAQAFFLEYDYTTDQRLPYRSICAYWTLWAGVASPAQAQRLVAQLPDFEAAHGLSVTAEAYPSPHPEFTNLQWAYPLAWPPLQLIAAEGLLRYGYRAEAARLSRRFVGTQLTQYRQTGKLWEKYNAVTGSLEFPLERYPSVPMRGWSAAAAVVLGRLLFA